MLTIDISTFSLKVEQVYHSSKLRTAIWLISLCVKDHYEKYLRNRTYFEKALFYSR